MDIIRFPFHKFFFGLFHFQWVVIHSTATVPIAGPLALAMDDLQNAVFIGSLLNTRCFSDPADPFMVVAVGSDNVLSPNEFVLTGLWFFKTEHGPISYIPRVLSGIPTQ